MMLGSELVGVEFVGLSFDECVALLVEMGFESEMDAYPQMDGGCAYIFVGHEFSDHWELGFDEFDVCEECDFMEVEDQA